MPFHITKKVRPDYVIVQAFGVITSEEEYLHLINDYFTTIMETGNTRLLGDERNLLFPRNLILHKKQVVSKIEKLPDDIHSCKFSIVEKKEHLKYAEYWVFYCQKMDLQINAFTSVTDAMDHLLH